MKKIAIIGANDFQNPLILEAKKLGYETHVFAWQDGSIGEKTADFFYPISIIEKEKILEKCRELKIDAITTIASDLATITVNFVAEKLGLPGNSMLCTEISTNKYKMRKAFQQHNVPTPAFEIVETENDLYKLKNIKYPCIIKPTDRSGSRAITKVNNEVEIAKAIKQATEQSFEKKAIVEEYIEGEEFSAEGISFKGKHKILAITRKSTTGAPHFIETGHIQPAGLSSEQEQKVHEDILKGIVALGIQNGATHSEFKITPEGEIRIIEIGARMGGDCIGSDLVKISTGLNYVKMVIDVALGKQPEFKKENNSKIAIIRFIFNKKDLENFQKIKKENPEMIYFVSDLKNIDSHEVVDSSTRFGYYILACENKNKIRWLLNDKEQY